MYLLSDQLPADSVLQNYDICIVGAGAAGIALAKRLIGSSLRVLLLASGQPSDRGRPPEYRQRIYRGTVGGFLAKVDPVFSDRSRLHMYGGTTNHFGFWSLPLDPLDFQARPGVRAASWPFPLSDLTAYYQAAHEFGHFGPFNYDDLPFWEAVFFARRFPAASDAPLKEGLIRAQYAEELHDFQIQFGAELQAAPNITVLFNAHLVEILTHADQQHVTGLRCARLENGQAGATFTVQAHRYVLALGGIENVRFLQMAQNLGDNAAGHLGRGFMVHPLITSAARITFERPVPLETRNFFRDQQVRLQAPQQAGAPYTHISAPLVNPEDVQHYCVFNAWGILVPKPQTLIAHECGNFRVILRFNAAGDQAEVNINWEQMPNEASRITLNPAQLDPVFGQPVSHVDWQLLDIDKHTARQAIALCFAHLQPHGASQLTYLTDLSGGAHDWTFAPQAGALATGDHHMGAIRMSDAPANGLTNADARLHTVDNLYIAGCATFPTGGFANPTLTIVALALRLADHLKNS